MNIFVSKDDGRYRYLYKITNTLTGQYYYGIHTTYNLDDGYMGSGKRLKLDQKRLGINNFKKEYIEFFNDNNALLAAERKVVNWDILRDPLCYNIILGGGGDIRGVSPIRNIITGEVKAKPLNDDYDKTIWVHITTNRKRIHKIINNIVVSKYVYESDLQNYLDEGWVRGGLPNISGKIKINNTKKTKYVYESELQKYLDEGWVRGGLPIACKGNIRIINNDKTKEKLVKPQELQKYLDEGWVRGSMHTGRIHIYRGLSEHKMVYPNELQKYLDEGWVRGSNDHSILGKIKIIRNNDCIVINPNELQKYLDEGWVRGSKPSTAGKTVISKDGKNKFIYPDDLQKYLDEGWVKGKIKKIPPKN